MGDEKKSAKTPFVGNSRSLYGGKCKNNLGLKVDNAKCILDTENDKKITIMAIMRETVAF